VHYDIAMSADDADPRPSLFRDPADGSAGWPVRLVVAIAAAVFLAGSALILSYLLAAVVPARDRGLYGAGRPSNAVYPRDELVAFLMLAAAALWITCVVWLFFRKVHQRVLVYPGLLTSGIILAAVALGVFVDNTLRGDRELIEVGIGLIAGASVLVIWLQAVRNLRRQRPLRNRIDNLPDVRCPQCGYRMVGLHESRCPECGQIYTLDELIARQNFDPKLARTPVIAEKV